MRIGEARIDFDGNIIESATGQHIVEPKIMKLLKVLSEKPNNVFSREELITSVWGVDYGGDERLSRAVSLLRKALGDKRGQHTYIETISRRGYRLIADISLETDIVAEDPNDEEPIETATPTDTKDPKPTPWLTGALSLALATALILLVFIGLRPTDPVHNLSVNDSLTAGFEKLHFFGHPNAVEDAQNYFQSALKQDPDNAAAHAGLSLAYIREFTSSESDPVLIKHAKSSALRALQQNEHLALSHIAMAWAAEFDRDKGKALQYLERADLLDKDNELILESRFRLLGSAGDFAGAEALILKSIELYPENALFHSNAAKLFVFMKDLPAAEKYAQDAISLDPQNPWLYASSAQILHLQNRTPEAIKVIQSGLEFNESAALYNNLGTYLFFDGHYDMAASAFEKTLRLDGNTHDPLFWANLGDAYRWINGKQDLSNQHFRRAIQIWKEGLAQNPKSLDLRTRVALYEAKMGSEELPMDFFAEVAERENLPAIQYYRAMSTAEITGKREIALSLLSKTINAGYPLNEIRNDPELEALREDQRYHVIISQ